MRGRRTASHRNTALGARRVGRGRDALGSSTIPHIRHRKCTDGSDTNDSIQTMTLETLEGMLQFDENRLVTWTSYIFKPPKSGTLRRKLNVVTNPHVSTLAMTRQRCRSKQLIVIRATTQHRDRRDGQPAQIPPSKAHCTDAAPLNTRLTHINERPKPLEITDSL